MASERDAERNYHESREGEEIKAARFLQKDDHKRKPERKTSKKNGVKDPRKYWKDQRTQTNLSLAQRAGNRKKKSDCWKSEVHLHENGKLLRLWETPRKDLGCCAPGRIKTQNEEGVLGRQLLGIPT